MATKKAASTEDTESTESTGETYTVKERDSWWSIAKDIDQPINELLAANRATVSTVINPGDPIKLPGSAIPPEDQQPPKPPEDVAGPPEEEVKT